MSNWPEERKTNSSPTKEMAEKKALGQIGEEKPQDRDNQYKEEDAFKEKELWDHYSGNCGSHIIALLFCHCELSHSLPWAVVNITVSSKMFQLSFQVYLSNSPAEMPPRKLTCSPSTLVEHEAHPTPEGFSAIRQLLAEDLTQEQPLWHSIAMMCEEWMPNFKSALDHVYSRTGKCYPVCGQSPLWCLSCFDN